MAKIKYDVSDVEPGVDYDTPIPRGLYRCKVADVQSGESKSSGNPMLTVEYEIVERGDFKGRKLWDYIVLNDSSAWKLKQFTDALGLNGRGTLDTDEVVGDQVMVRVKHEADTRDPDNPVTRARVGNVAALPDDSEEEEEEDTGDDDDDGAGAELTLGDLEGMDKDELEEIIEDEDLDVKFNSKTKVAVLRDRVAEALGLDEDEEEDEDDEDEGEDYDGMSLKDLRAELKSRGLSTKGRKVVLVERLEEDDNDGEPF